MLSKGRFTGGAERMGGAAATVRGGKTLRREWDAIRSKRLRRGGGEQRGEKDREIARMSVNVPMDGGREGVPGEKKRGRTP